jgi:hypothetical protein
MSTPSAAHHKVPLVELVVLIGFALAAALLYSVVSLAYIPLRALCLKRAGSDIWAFLTARRLMLTGASYLLSAPVPGLLAIMISAGGVGGSHAVGISDEVEKFAWIFFFACLAAAAVSLGLIMARPRPAEGEDTATSRNSQT